MISSTKTGETARGLGRIARMNAIHYCPLFWSCSHSRQRSRFVVLYDQIFIASLIRDGHWQVPLLVECFRLRGYSKSSSSSESSLHYHDYVYWSLQHACLATRKLAFQWYWVECNQIRSMSSVLFIYFLFVYYLFLTIMTIVNWPFMGSCSKPNQDRLFLHMCVVALLSRYLTS